jgi:hypothetical protein
MMNKFTFINAILLLAIFIGMSWLAGQAYGAENTLTFSWQQKLAEDFAGWTLYQSSDNSTFSPVVDIPYEVESTTYTSTQTLTGEGMQYFYLTARDTSGNESEPSNVASYEFPDTTAPSAPFELTITVGE